MIELGEIYDPKLLPVIQTAPFSWEKPTTQISAESKLQSETPEEAAQTTTVVSEETWQQLGIKPYHRSKTRIPSDF